MHSKIIAALKATSVFVGGAGLLVLFALYPIKVSALAMCALLVALWRLLYLTFM